MPPAADLRRVALFAAERHKNQRRKDAETSPYINHPLAVVLFAALLHVTIEDIATTREQLEAEFGVKLTSVVLEVSDNPALSAAERKRLQVQHAPKVSARAKRVRIRRQDRQPA